MKINKTKKNNIEGEIKTLQKLCNFSTVDVEQIEIQMNQLFFLYIILFC